MSGATSAQISSFATQWAPYAQQAGTQLGVSPGTILAQWAAESGYGTNSGSANYNVGGIMLPNTNAQASYASPSAFENAFVNLIQSGYSSAENTGSDIDAYVSGLANGASGAYFGNGTTSAAYSSLLSGTESTIANAAPIAASSLGSPAPSSPALGSASNLLGLPSATGTAAPSTSATPAATTAANSACTGGTLGIGGIFTWACWQGVAADLAFVGIGLVVFLLAVASGLFGGSLQRSFKRSGVPALA